MTNTPGWTGEQDRKVAAVTALVPRIAHLQVAMQAEQYRLPVAVTLPKELDPGPYLGPDRTEVAATFMGLPIIWNDINTTGLVYSA